VRRARRAPGACALSGAAKALSCVAFEGRSSSVALAAFERSADRAAIHAIALGSVRWYLRLAPATESLLSRPRGTPDEIRCLLVAAAHQIEYSRNPVHSTVLAAVDAARILGIPAATGLVNAVLRRFIAERTSLMARVDEPLAARTAHPQWLVDELLSAWPAQAAAILEANNGHPPMVLRVDLSRRTRDSYLAELAASGIAASAVSWAPAAVKLDSPVALAGLPGFQSSPDANPGAAVGDTDTAAASATGDAAAGAFVSVQDAGAQLVPRLLDVRPGMSVLDACAAPGGKTGHLLEHAPALGRLLAVDIDSERVARIEANLARLHRQARILVGDVSDPATFWDGTPFDRILVDAPCSSTGVIRRHPDIKLLRRRSDIPGFAAAQLKILQAAFRMLAPGGRLLYSTCSVLGAEDACRGAAGAGVAVGSSTKPCDVASPSVANSSAESTAPRTSSRSERLGWRLTIVGGNMCS